MGDPMLKTVAWAALLVCRLAGHPGEGSSSRCLGLKRRGGMATTLATIAVFAVTACGSGQTPAPEPVQTPEAEPEMTQADLPEPDPTASAEPEVVVSALIDAMAANDGERMRSLFDANASQAYRDGPARSGEAFFSWLESDIIQREGRVENAQLAVNGNEVVVTGQYHSQGYTSEANFLLTVENGRITRWQMRY